MRHDSRNAEQIAYHYHVIWAVLCVLNAAVFIFGMVTLEPIASLNHPLAFPFKAAYWLSLGQVFMSLFGIIWHVWGARQHAGEIRRFEQSHNRPNGPLNCS